MIRSRYSGVLAVIVSTFLLLLVATAASAQDTNGFSDNSDLDAGADVAPAGPRHFGKLSFSGYLKNETAYRFNEPRSITKIRNIFSLTARYPFSNSSSLTVSGWAYYDLAYDLFDYETIAARFVRDENQPLVFVDNLSQKKDSPVAAIREFYVDIYRPNYDLRLGKQFVIWGVLEGMRITDEINPLDFRELITPDLLDYRIPLWTAKVDYYLPSATVEGIWIPDLRFHKPAPPGSEWELLQEVPNTTFPDSFTIRDSEFGIKLTREISGGEIALSYFYTWDDFPVIFRSARIDSATDPVFFPTYTRINMYGATLVKDIGGSILKGELAYVPDKYFGLHNNTDKNNDGYLDSQGELKRRHIRWGLGLDFNINGFDLSPGIAQWIILDYDRDLIQDKYDTSLTLFARKPMWNQSAVFQVLAIALVNLHELYLKPKITFNITDHFQIATGFDLFYGKRSTLGLSASGGAVTNLNSVEQSAQFFGNFNDNDRVFAEFKYAF